MPQKRKVETYRILASAPKTYISFLHTGPRRPSVDHLRRTTHTYTHLHPTVWFLEGFRCSMVGWLVVKGRKIVDRGVAAHQGIAADMLVVQPVSLSETP
jgi:hypothetical protein